MTVKRDLVGTLFGDSMYLLTLQGSVYERQNLCCTLSPVMYFFANFLRFPGILPPRANRTLVLFQSMQLYLWSPGCQVNHFRKVFQSVTKHRIWPPLSTIITIDGNDNSKYVIDKDMLLTAFSVVELGITTTYSHCSQALPKKYILCFNLT